MSYVLFVLLCLFVVSCCAAVVVVVVFVAVVVDVRGYRFVRVCVCNFFIDYREQRGDKTIVFADPL